MFGVAAAAKDMALAVGLGEARAVAAAAAAAAEAEAEGGNAGALGNAGMWNAPPRPRVLLPLKLRATVRPLRPCEAEAVARAPREVDEPAPGGRGGRAATKRAAATAAAAAAAAAARKSSFTFLAGLRRVARWAHFLGCQLS